MRISVFPKGDLDALVVHKTMTIFDWIEKAKVLPAEGLELYSGMFTETSDSFVSPCSVHPQTSPTPTRTYARPKSTARSR